MNKQMNAISAEMAFGVFVLWWAASGTRSHDIFVTNEMLYRLSYCGHLCLMVEILFFALSLTICKDDFCIFQIQLTHSRSSNIGGNCADKALSLWIIRWLALFYNNIYRCKCKCIILLCEFFFRQGIQNVVTKSHEIIRFCKRIVFSQKWSLVVVELVISKEFVFFCW